MTLATRPITHTRKPKNPLDNVKVPKVAELAQYFNHPLTTRVDEAFIPTFETMQRVAENTGVWLLLLEDSQDRVDIERIRSYLDNRARKAGRHISTRTNHRFSILIVVTT